MKKLIACILALGLLGSCKKEELTYDQLVELTTSKSNLDYLVYAVEGDFLVNLVMKEFPTSSAGYNIDKNRLLTYEKSRFKTVTIICNPHKTCKFFANGKEYRESSHISDFNRGALRGKEKEELERIFN